MLQTARSYVFTTAAPAMLAHALAASLAIIREDGSRRVLLTALIQQWQAGARALPWKTLASETAIQPLIVGGNSDALRLSDWLWEHGVWVPAIRPPTVPPGSSRLRITLSALHRPS